MLNPPCYSCGNSGVAPTTGSNGVTQTLNHSDCEGISTDLLNMFKRLMVCVKLNNLYQIASVTEAEITSGINILDLWLAAKQEDPATCEYQDKLPLLQAITNKIVAYAQC